MVDADGDQAGVHRAAGALTVAEAAGALGVSPVTVRRMIADGRLSAIRLGPPPSGHLRVPPSSLESLARRGRAAVRA